LLRYILILYSSKQRKILTANRKS